MALNWHQWLSVGGAQQSASASFQVSRLRSTGLQALLPSSALWMPALSAILEWLLSLPPPSLTGVLRCARTLHAWCPADDTNPLKHHLHDRTLAALRPANCLQLGAPSGFCMRGLQASEAVSIVSRTPCFQALRAAILLEMHTRRVLLLYHNDGYFCHARKLIYY